MTEGGVPSRLEDGGRTCGDVVDAGRVGGVRRWRGCDCRVIGREPEAEPNAGQLAEYTLGILDVRGKGARALGAKVVCTGGSVEIALESGKVAILELVADLHRSDGGIGDASSRWESSQEDPSP